MKSVDSKTKPKKTKCTHFNHANQAAADRSYLLDDEQEDRLTTEFSNFLNSERVCKCIYTLVKINLSADTEEFHSRI